MRYDSSDPEQVAERKTKAELRERREVEELQWVLGHAAGRAVIWRILAKTGLFGASFTGEALSSAWNEGKRAVGIEIFEEVLTARRDAYTVMQQEAIRRAEEERGETHAAGE